MRAFTLLLNYWFETHGSWARARIVLPRPCVAFIKVWNILKDLSWLIHNIVGMIVKQKKWPKLTWLLVKQQANVRWAKTMNTPERKVKSDERRKHQYFLKRFKKISQLPQEEVFYCCDMLLLPVIWLDNSISTLSIILCEAIKAWLSFFSHFTQYYLK